MTKSRAPLTWPDAMTRVAGVVTFAQAAHAVARSDRCVRDWSDPETGTVPTLAQALTLDALYRVSGGEGAPFLETYAHLLDVRMADLDADRRELTAEIAVAARECGEALAAGLAVTQSNASPLETHRALAEAEQAHSAIGALKRRLTSFLPFGAGPNAGKAGGTPE